MPRTAAAKTAAGSDAPAEGVKPETESPAADAPKKTGSTKRDTGAPEPCAECFPTGWPEGVESAGCEHGSWTRGSEN